MDKRITKKENINRVSDKTPRSFYNALIELRHHAGGGKSNKSNLKN